MRNLYFIFILFFGFLANLFAQDQVKTSLDFVENKGQWDETVKYRLGVHGGRLYFQNDGIIYDMYDLEDIHEISEQIHHDGNGNRLSKSESLIDCHAYKVSFVKGNVDQFIPEIKKIHHYNFLLGNDSSKWASSVGAYEVVRAESVYKGIDARFYSKGLNFKYDFIVNPKGNLKDIKLKYEGLNEIYLKKGNLYLVTSFDQVVEQKPYVYQIVNGEKVQIEAEYVLSGNLVSYKIGSYDKTKDLIIDPVVVASTYSGSTETIYGHTATYDQAGNIFSAGAGFSPGGLPVTTGAYQTSFAGAREMCINKYNPNGSTLIYATYLGGTGDDYPHSLYNHNNNLYILGSSASNNFPTTPSAYDQTYNGGFCDIVVSVLSANGGGLIGSTYVGGSGDDGQNSISANYGDEYRGEIVVDNAGNAYVASMTESSNFPTSNNAYQPTYGGGFQDGVALKLNPNLSTLVFSTYLGGSSDDAAYGIIVDGNKTYVTGTAGNGFLGTGSAFNYSGGRDGFVVALNAGATAALHKTYFGSSSNDQSFFIEKDLSGNIYILGQTSGAIPATAGRYSGGNGLFVTKFNNILSARQWTSTTKSVAPVAFLVDDCNYIYASGHGGLSSLTGFGITSNAVQSASAGFYLMALAPQATGLSYGTYYGSSDSHVDGGTSRFDKRGVVYQATCTDNGFPTLGSAYSSSNQTGSSYDVTVFKIDFEISEIKAKAEPLPDSVGCAPFNVNFNNTSGGNKYFWDFNDGSPIVNTKNPSHTFVNPGIYNVRLIAIDSNSTCIKPDTVYIKIEALSTSSTTYKNDTAVCTGSAVQLWANGATSYAWSPAASLSNPNIANPIANPLVTTTYRVIGTSICNTDTGYVKITVNSITTNISDDTLVCVGSSVPLWATGGVTYLWSPATGLSATNIANPIATPGVTTTYSVLITSADGCTNTETVTVNIQQGLPVPSISADMAKCPLDPVILTVSGGASYYWYSNHTILNPNSNSITVSQPVTTTYYVDVTNVCGTVTDSVIVSVQKPVAASAPDDTICYNDTISLWASGGVNYYWSPASKVFNPTQSHTQAYPGSPTVFTVIVEDNIGCRDTAYTTISFFPKPSIDAGPDKIVTYGEGVDLTPIHTPGTVYWDYHTTLNCVNCIDNYAQPETTTTYTVNILDEYGCVASDKVTVSVDGVLYVPNAFTPNGDGDNDVFYVKGADITEYQLFIFNRWGDLIFESTDMNQGWDGTYKGVRAKTDVYVYKVKYSDVDTPNQTRTGHINLLR